MAGETSRRHDNPISSRILACFIVSHWWVVAFMSPLCHWRMPLSSTLCDSDGICVRDGGLLNRPDDTIEWSMQCLPISQIPDSTFELYERSGPMGPVSTPSTTDVKSGI